MKKKKFWLGMLVMVPVFGMILGCASSTFVRVQQIYSSDLNGQSFNNFIMNYLTERFSYNWEIVENDDFNRNKEYIDIKDECMEELKDRITLYQSSIGKVFYMAVTRGEERYYTFILITEGIYNVTTKELTSFSYRIIIIKLK